MADEPSRTFFAERSSKRRCAGFCAAHRGRYCLRRDGNDLCHAHHLQSQRDLCRRVGTVRGQSGAVTAVRWHARLPYFTRIEQEVPLMNQW